MSDTHGQPPPLSAEKVLNALKDAPVAYRDSLRLLYVSASRKFTTMQQERVDLLADHYLELDDLLSAAECFQEQQQNAF